MKRFKNNVAAPTQLNVQLYLKIFVQYSHYIVNEIWSRLMRKCVNYPALYNVHICYLLQSFTQLITLDANFLNKN